MSDIVKLNESESAVTVAQTMIQKIGEMVVNPAVDVDKIERLFDIQIKMMNKQAEIEFNAALCALQADMPSITKDGAIRDREGKIASRYATYENIHGHIKPLLSVYGFSIVHTNKDVEGKKIVETTLKHKSGHSIKAEIILPYDSTNAMKNAVQAAVSTVSYGKRQNVCNLLSIVPDGEDDDGQKSVPLISDAEGRVLLGLIDETNSDMDKFLKAAGVESFEQIKQSDYKRLKVALETKKQKIAGGLI